MHGKRGSCSRVSPRQKTERGALQNMFARKPATYGTIYMQILEPAMNTLCMLPYAQKYLHGYSNVLLSLGDVIYWLHCQSTSIYNRLNFYRSEHNLMDIFHPERWIRNVNQSTCLGVFWQAKWSHVPKSHLELNRIDNTSPSGPFQTLRHMPPETPSLWLSVRSE